jgi:ABC-2 type transport system permease protein
MFLILKREYFQRVKSPGFIVGTVVGVLGLAALGFLPTLLTMLDQNTASKIAVVDPRNIVYPYLEVLSQPTPTPVPGQAPSTGQLPLTQSIDFIEAETEDQAVLAEQVNEGEITAYLVVNGDKPSNATFTYYGTDRPDGLEAAQLNAYLSAALTQGKLQEFGVTPEQAQALFAPAELTVEPIPGAELVDETARLNSTALVYFLLIGLYILILMYGVQVAMGVVEEKSSRVMEMLITAVRPIELMAGKVLGVGAAGMTQAGLWVLSGLVLLLFGGVLGSAVSGIGIDVASVPALTLLAFLTFFILGYLLYAAMYAALGSLVSKVEDVNSITAPLTIVNVGVYLVSFYALADPDAQLVRILSFVPFFTPMVMFIRVALGSAAIWEFAVGAVLVAITSYGLTWLAARIYRVGVLLYGKRPSVGEIVRLLRTT